MGDDINCGFALAIIHSSKVASTAFCVHRPGIRNSLKPRDVGTKGIKARCEKAGGFVSQHEVGNVSLNSEILFSAFSLVLVIQPLGSAASSLSTSLLFHTATLVTGAGEACLTTAARPCVTVWLQSWLESRLLHWYLTVLTYRQPRSRPHTASIPLCLRVQVGIDRHHKP